MKKKKNHYSPGDLIFKIFLIVTFGYAYARKGITENITAYL